MKNKSILNTLMLSSLLSMSCTTWAVDKTENIDVTVKNNEGQVTIIKNIDGNRKTIEEFFVAKDPNNIQKSINEILEKHGISQNHSHQTSHNFGPHNKNMIWIQKNDGISVDLENGQATVIINKDNNGEIETIEQSIEINSDTDINALIDNLMLEHGIEVNAIEGHRKIIKLDKHFTQIDNDKPRMGFMANAQEQGWDIISVVPASGADEGGLKKGDLVISIDGQSTAKDGLGLTEFVDMDKQVGDISKVLVLRDNQQIPLDIEAKVIDSPDIIMEMNGNHNWLTSSGNDFKLNTDDLDGKFKGLHLDVEHLDKMITSLGNKKIHVVTTSDADAYFFSGSKMNQWLGKNHHFSTVTESLGKYFGTTKGVLVLEVDLNNKLGLQDGDVIQAINGKDVQSPKDVVKIMSGFKSNESFEIEIIREKETIYLES